MEYIVRVYDNGRIMLPAALRKKRQLEPGQELILSDTDSGMLLTTKLDNIERLRRKINQHIPAGVSLVDELIADRRREAAEE